MYWIIYMIIVHIYSYIYTHTGYRRTTYHCGRCTDIQLPQVQKLRRFFEEVTPAWMKKQQSRPDLYIFVIVKDQSHFCSSGVKTYHFGLK